MRNLAAFTHEGTNPSFISVNETDNKNVEILVRNAVNPSCNCVGTIAMITLSTQEYQKFLAEAVKTALGYSKDI